MKNTGNHLVVCENCGTKNRILKNKSNASAKCGKCGSPLRINERRESPKEYFFFRCSACGTRNRIPAAKINDSPTCGKCGSTLQTHELFVPQPITVTDSNFESNVLQSPLPVLVYAWAPWCSTCTVVTPVIDGFAKDSKGKIRVGKLNVDGNPKLSSKYNIRSVPFLFIFDNGQLKETLPGALKKNELMMKMAHYF